MHPLRLPRGELGVAGVERVVHVVVDGVGAGSRACVLADRAAGRRRLLGGRVVDEVAGLVAGAIEGVLEVEPVSRLMRERLAPIEAAHIGVRGSRHGAPVDHDPVQVRLGRVGDLGQVGPAQIRAAAGGVDIERVVSALLQGLLHLVLSAARARGIPDRVIGPSDPGEREGEVRPESALAPAERLVQHRDLILELPVREIPKRSVGDDMEVHRDGRREVRLGFALGRRREVAANLGVVGFISLVFYSNVARLYQQKQNFVPGI